MADRLGKLKTSRWTRVVVATGSTRQLQLVAGQTVSSTLDGQRIPADFVGEPGTKIFTGDRTASDNSDGTERGPKSTHEGRQIARGELDRILRSWQIATC
jgi:hypothetical protein